ncbi:MAG: hypothetical protein IJD92_02615 [Bacilli bacterium]|nr:hypothetical protein [Bacilli bacterium]
MDNYGNFFVEFLTPFFEGLISIFKSIFAGIVEMFNIIKYIDTVNEYKDTVNIVFIIISILCLLLLICLLSYVIYYIIKKTIKVVRKSHEQDALLEEVEKLNYDMIKLKQENDKLTTMAENMGADLDENGNPITKIKDGESRFYKLTEIDSKWENYTPEVPFNNSLSLKDICESFRNYAASELGLYYTPELIRLFISAFSSSRIIILQGISGTGKTSLAYAFGHFLGNDSVIAPVQPSWRDRTELFGYFNEFTKRFNETELLSKMYEATYNDKIYITILDEMNIARVEYYFAEMLSIMEMPDKKEWNISLVATPWENDPKKIVNGIFTLPGNMWYIGTINNDDSTFMVTDKVYDRAMPIDINEKCAKFEAPKTESINISDDYLESLFDDAQKKNPITEEMLKKLDELDQYIIEHFRISFGNRILKQIEDFVPVYVECGGTEVDAIDYLICAKILRKFEQLNLAFIKNELDEFINYLNVNFGNKNMNRCKDFILRLKKSI